MKTSNYIFLSFVIFLFGGMLLLFIGTKNYKDSSSDSNWLTQEKPLKPFSVVVAAPEANFVLKNGTQNKIAQSYLKTVTPNFAPFVVRNDTLFVYSVKKEEKLSKGGYLIITPEIYCQNIKSIVAKENASIRMDHFQADQLKIHLTKTQLNWSFGKITTAAIEAKESNIYFEGESIGTLEVQLDHTQMNVPLKKGISNASGSVKNNSTANLSVEGKINLDIDKSSSFSATHFVTN